MKRIVWIVTKSLFLTLRAILLKVDIKDTLILAGTALIGVGIYQRFGLWLSLIVCGLIFLAFGIAMLIKTDGDIR